MTTNPRRLCGTMVTGSGDCCRPAVVRAYQELRGKGQPDRFAFEAAVTVYCWHHPDVSAAEACDIVLGWVSDGLRH